MKNKFQAWVLLSLCVVTSLKTLAQGVRYHDMVFKTFTVDSVVYSDTFNLKMTICQPAGDSLCHRPVLVFAHGGSFIEGSRNGGIVADTLCIHFARRGYVAVSIDYRLGVQDSMLNDSVYALNEMAKALSDAKAAVRFMRKDAYTTNNYRVDTNLIFFSGSSAGAVIAMHYLYLTNINQASPALQAAVNNNGGIEGNSGNAGYSSRVNAILSLAGGLNDPGFLVAGAKPVAHFQGNLDSVVPYFCNEAEDGGVQVRLCGLGSLNPIYNSLGMVHLSMIYPGLGHVPWSTNPAMMIQIDSMSANFLDSITLWPGLVYCNSTTGITQENADDLISVFPNPAKQQVTVLLSQIHTFNFIEITDCSGRLVAKKQVSSTSIRFDCSDIAAGVYFLRVVKSDGSAAVRKMIIE